MKKLYNFLYLALISSSLLAQSEPSTYFNIYVPPNNNAVKRNVALIVTAVSDSTQFSIVDDGMDGDSDDHVQGILMAGESYVLYLKDNGINDDAKYASGGTLKRDGDYFTITSNKIVYASMSTDSDWQHDFVPSVNKKSVGQKFFVYAPKISSSARDLNVFAYETATTISIYKISSSNTTRTGYTNVNLSEKQLVVQKTIQPGEDIIYHSSEGRNLLETGATYLIESNKNVSVQYGALWGNARDGGAYVPSKNGSGSGDLFYFAVPYQNAGEQEIRIISWDTANVVELSRYDNGNWSNLGNWTLNEMEPADWVGKQNNNATYPAVFRVSCTAGKRVSVMEANWMETGSTNTSDMSTMLSSETGTSSGNRFLAYMLPPSRQDNVINPFTGQFFSGSNTHFYLFASSKNTTVTIKDAKTNGQVLNKSYQIDSARYVDAYFTLNEWKSIYNGTGTPDGSERPYVLIESSEPIAVLSSNFNDNWMNYFGSSLPQSFTQTGSLSNPEANPGEEVLFTSSLRVEDNQFIENANIEVKIGSGLIPIACKLKNKGQQVQVGNIKTLPEQSTVAFDSLVSISDTDDYAIETTVKVSPNYNKGNRIPDKTVVSLETVVSGMVDGEFQQSYHTQGLQNNADNLSNLLYDDCPIPSMASVSNNSWNPSWIDYDNDGYEDLFIATKDTSEENELYRNNGDNTFTKITNHPLVQERTNTVATIWADINNDGRKDVLLVNATQHRSKFFINNGNGDFTVKLDVGIDPHPQYFHGAAMADFDNDGLLDLIITNFFETRFHQLYRNNGDNTFSSVTNSVVTLESERSMAPVLADYDNDGLVDIFIPNGNDRPNSLFKNLGNFQFEKVEDAAIRGDTKSSVGAAWGDYDRDGFPDLLVVNASAQNNDFYKNNGDGTFQKLDSSILSLQGGDSHGAAWFDANNDGWLDVYIANDQGSSFLYINDGAGGFSRKLDEVIAGDNGNTYGVAVGDYDKNGQLDLAVATHTTGATQLFCHNGNAGNWIGFQLQGLFSNKQALGARVAIKANGVWQYRQNLPVSGFGSQNMQNIHFGIDDASSVDSVLVIWPSGIKQFLTNYSINTYNMVLEEAGKQVTGYVFHDLDGNGLLNEGEPMVANVRLNINKGKINLASKEDGTFRFRINEDSLRIGLNQIHWSIDSAYTEYQFLQGQDSIHLMLPVEAVQVGYDLGISLSTTALRRGFTNETTVQVWNQGTVMAEHVNVELVLPSEAYLLSSDRTDSLLTDKTYRWNLDTLHPGGIKTIHIIDSIGLEATTGQFLVLEANTYATGTDLDSTNNRLREEIEVVGAIDPNDILVSPKGDGPQGYINKNQWLTYTIRFENVGTYKATYVFLENQIPEGLDLETFEIISTSHDYTYTLTEKGLLEVSYRYIDLPPAVEDSIGAHGHFKYRIKPLSTVSGDLRLANNAKIVFDFEEPIITNTVVNTIKREGSHEVKSLKVYPNPSSDFVQIVLDEQFYRVTHPQVIKSWQILNATGQVVLAGTGNFNSVMKLNIGTLPSGVYVVYAFDQNDQLYVARILKE